MQTKTIKAVEGGYILTISSVEGNRIVEHSHLFHSQSEAKAYAATNFI